MKIRVSICCFQRDINYFSCPTAFYVSNSSYPPSFSHPVGTCYFVKSSNSEILSFYGSSNRVFLYFSLGLLQSERESYYSNLNYPCDLKHLHYVM
jgi:hypothetical protein